MLDRRGSAAVEFAIVGPVLLTVCFASLSLGLGFWRVNTLQGVAQAAARCVALGSPACSTVPTGCASGSAAVCYVLTLASGRGVGNVNASDVTVAGSVPIGGATFTTVTIAITVNLFVTTVNFSAQGSFPNS